MTYDTITELIREGTAIHSRTTLDQVTRAARSRKRRLHGAITAVAVAGSTAGALALQSVGGVAPAAWAVERSASDTVTVTIAQLRDAAGLQRTLRADGVAASVDYASHPCAYPPAPLLSGIKAFTASTAPGALEVVQIHPAALPPGTTLMISINSSGGKIAGQPSLLIQVVQGARPTCLPPGTPFPPKTGQAGPSAK